MSVCWSSDRRSRKLPVTYFQFRKAQTFGSYFFMMVAANGIWQKNPALAWREIENETVTFLRRKRDATN